MNRKKLAATVEKMLNHAARHSTRPGGDDRIVTIDYASFRDLMREVIAELKNKEGPS